MTTIILPGLVLPSGNIRERLHWGARHRLGKRCRLALLTAGAAILDGQLKLMAPAKRRLIITRVGGRVMDAVNLGFAIKPLEDAIRDRGWLVDDSPTWCELDVRQRPRFRGECAGYVVQIEDCENA